MTQKEFNAILKKYLDGHCTPEEEREIEAWYSSQKNDPIAMEAEERATVEKKIWNGIVQKASLKRKFKIVKSVWIAGAAACILLVGGILLLNFNMPTPENPSVLATDKSLTLPDGSRVRLSDNAQIHYDEYFNKKHRNISLTGSAFFDVTPDRTKPFIISSGDLITEVVGTSFEIAQNPELNTIEVKVVSGEVTVYNPAQKKQTKTVLTPNQKVVYNRLFKNINRTLVESPQPLATNVAVEPKFVFVNTSLKEVTKTFKEVYGIDFKIEDKKIEDCLVNADLENLPMFTKLDLICRSLEASYLIQGTTVFLNGEGCN
jgi:transmembrane sensor